MKTAVALRHIQFEDLGVLEPLLRQQGYAIQYLDVGVDDLALVEVAAPDLLFVLGAPLGACDEDAYPFLADELRLVGRRLESGRPLLGICLGAQLIARALGGEVKPMGIKEIGFSSLTLTPEGRASPLGALGTTPVLHWHGDEFAIPTGATKLASSDICAHQAFALGRAVLGLQFHLEADPLKIERWLVGHACELVHARVDPRDLRREARELGPALSRAATEVIAAWLKQAY